MSGCKPLRDRIIYESYKELNLFTFERYEDSEYANELWELYTSTKHKVMSFKDWLYGYCFEGISIDEKLKIGEMRE